MSARSAVIARIARSSALCTVLLGPGVAGAAAPGPPPACRWEAKAYVAVRDDTRLPDLGAHAVFTGARPAVVPTPDPYVWNPAFPVDAQGRVHGRSDGRVSSILTISGAGCSEAHVAVLVYSDGFVPRRGVAFDYGPSRSYDELSPGKNSLGSFAVLAEAQAPFRLRPVWLSADARSIAYDHEAGYVTNVGDRSATYRPAFDVRDDSLELRGGVTLARGGPVLDVAYLNAGTNAYRPGVNGLGVALEVPPQLGRTLSANGSLSYYPSLVGGGIAYSALRYRVAGTLALAALFGSPYYFDLALMGDQRTNVSRAPASTNYRAIMLGIGYRLGGIR